MDIISFIMHNPRWSRQTDLYPSVMRRARAGFQPVTCEFNK